MQAAKAVYPGSFDVLTNGHVDLIHRSAALFPHLVVAIARNDRKTPLFSVEERLAMLRTVTEGMPAVEVAAFDGLTVDFLARIGATVIIRGLRAVSDFEFELQMALMNHSMAPGIETIFLAPAAEYSFLSSSLIRELASQGKDVADYVPPPMAQALKKKLGSCAG